MIPSESFFRSNLSLFGALNTERNSLEIPTGDLELTRKMQARPDDEENDPEVDDFLDDKKFTEESRDTDEDYGKEIDDDLPKDEEFDLHEESDCDESPDDEEFEE